MPPKITTQMDAEGTLERSPDGHYQLRFERWFNHPLEKVWRTLTEPEHLRAWFPTDIEGERAAGAALRFTHRDQAFPPMEGRMIVFEPPSVLEFSWGEDDTLRFELRPDGAGCWMTFLNTFDKLGKAARDAAGWHECFDLLGYHLGGGRTPWTLGAHWENLHRVYVDRLGPEASTIGPPENWKKPD